MNRLLLMLFIFFVSCSGKPKLEMPADVMPQDSMVAILIDVHILEAASQLMMQVDSQKSKESEGFYEFIFSKHQTTKEKFDKSYNFYSTQPKMLEEIYADVMIGLSKKQAELKVKTKKTE